jgi:hypothetical protein
MCCSWLIDAAKSRLAERGENFGLTSLRVVSQSRTYIILVSALKFMQFMPCLLMLWYDEFSCLQDNCKAQAGYRL